jgi:tRNA (guanine9-N1)-methyltransferase
MKSMKSTLQYSSTNDVTDVQIIDPSVSTCSSLVLEATRAQVPERSVTSPTPSTQATITTTTTTTTQQYMSKNQRKKAQKRQLRQLLRQEKKQQEKQARRDAAIAAGRDWQAEQEFLQQRTLAGDRRRRHNEQWQQHIQQATQKGYFQIGIDCSFSHLMTEREIASLVQQLRYCYSYNKRASSPRMVTVTSINEGIQTLLERESGFSTWSQRGFLCTPTSLEDHFFRSHDRSKFVYLTSDAPIVLQQLEDDKIYIIGGIVDRNRFKGVTMTRATQQLKIATAKLPLKEYYPSLSSSRVLTCNHVFHLLIQYRELGNDWSQALHHVLPPRKVTEIREHDCEEGEAGMSKPGKDGHPD